MQIKKINHVEDCFDGSFIKEFLFTDSISESFILHLGQYGKLSYFKSFARPFFKIVFPGDFYIKGVEGNKSVRALLWNNENIDFIKSLISNY